MPVNIIEEDAPKNYEGEGIIINVKPGPVFTKVLSLNLIRRPLTDKPQA